MKKGYEKLWLWFGSSRASWITLPRSLAHEMPDEWQGKMADLLEEWDETWDTSEMPNTIVNAKKGRLFAKWPEFIINYRRPNREKINMLRVK